MKIHIKNHTKHMLFLAAMTAMITACDNEVPYEEGQATAADCMNVRFSPDNEMNFVFGEEDAAAADYSVDPHPRKDRCRCRCTGGNRICRRMYEA